MEKVVKILSTEYVTHNVKCFRLEKPKDYHFIPGQNAYLSINKEGWMDKRRPFSFTGLNSWDYLEFTIKIYRERKGVTSELEILKQGDELLISESFGTIFFKGKGVFIASGSGITPFMSILRQLFNDNKIIDQTLIFINKTSQDIIYGKELSDMLQENFFPILSKEKVIGFTEKKLDEEILKSIIRNFSQYFYLCGSEQFVLDIEKILENLGVKPEKLVIEK